MAVCTQNHFTLFLNRGGFGSLLRLLHAFFDFSDQGGQGHAHSIREHLADQDRRIPFSGFQVDDPGSANPGDFGQLLL